MSRDRAERALLRAVLAESCRDADRRQANLLKAIERAVHSGIYNAFK